MSDPRFVLSEDGETFAEELDKLIDAARAAAISTEDIAVALEDRAGRERRKADELS